MFIAYVEMKRIISYGSTNVFQKYKNFHARCCQHDCDQKT